MMMTISRVCELIIVFLLEAQSALSIFINVLSKKCHFIIDFYPLEDYSFIFPLFLLISVATEAAKYDSEVKENWSGGKSLQRLRDSPLSQTLVLISFLAREFFPAALSNHDWTSRIILSLIDQSLMWMAKDQVGIKVWERKFYCKSPSVHQSTISSFIEWYWMLSSCMLL